MAAKNPEAVEIERIMKVLEEGRAAKSPRGSLSEWLADRVSDSANGLARVAAGAVAGFENAGVSFSTERERQTRRTAQKILAMARSL